MSLCDFSFGITFSKVVFGENASFSLFDIKLSKPKTNPILIFFYRVKFVAFQTYFENIDFFGKYNYKLNNNIPLIAFRQCYLKDVYFTKCNMTLFSFYESAFFEESLFTSSIWPGVKDLSSLPYPIKDRLRICEEIYNTEQNKFLSSIESSELRHTIRFPDSYLEIAELYLRFKSSADKANDYHLASYFYQNEFEMKKLHWKSYFKNNKNLTSKIREVGYLFKSYLYGTYKLFTGYGEKPSKTIISFIIFLLVFAHAHLMNGIKTPTGVINYEYSFSIPNISNLLWNYLQCMLFAVYRVLPVTYLPLSGKEYTLLEFGVWDLSLYFLNSFILIILLVFIGIGLKRHFKRF